MNFTPGDAAYSLMLGDPLLPTQSPRHDSSKVVHVSIDPEVPITSSKVDMEEEEEAGESDPDRIITNARIALESDGLLSDQELTTRFQQIGRPKGKLRADIHKLYLYYIFVLDPPTRQVSILGLAKPHSAESLDPGLPQSKKCGSDHMSLCAELSWSKT
ncbi:hypothetical protein NLI96_g1353 [Meripilus lineatus]|uniref:Uncharacterized protein n=1 Tax=Meripilus lineatus TaxID=2056292 RepID=A0AAD5YN23_9APHY|nr:hypothetical protein NLI96_g1353 [Physisporinus lineatus]